MDEFGKMLCRQTRILLFILNTNHANARGVLAETMEPSGDGVGWVVRRIFGLEVQEVSVWKGGPLGHRIPSNF